MIPQQCIRTFASDRKIPSAILKVFLVVVLFALAVAPVSAQVNGAIDTTTSTGTTVNANLYVNKTDVYLNGGPKNTSDPGLTPGQTSTPVLYYFQVTDPSGSVLLSADDISCRQVLVQNGRIIGVPSAYESPYGTPPGSQSSGCDHPVGIVSPATLPANNEEPVELCPTASRTTDNLENGPLYDPNNWCDTTPNPGGEYKAWLTPQADYVGTGNPCPSGHGNNVFGFCDSDSKTDNFKVQFTPGPPPQCTPGDPGCALLSANLVACKYWDKNDDGAGIPDISADVPLGNWVINASTTNAALSINGSGPNASGTTDPTFGCTTFTVTGFTDATTASSVTLSEVQQANWNQVGPLQGTYSGGSGGDITVTGCNYSYPPGIPACTSTISVPLIGDGSTTVSPDFGNTGLDLTVTKTANPAFTRTYNWSISKTLVSPTGNPVEESGSSVKITYNVTASETGFVDSAWQVTGGITVANPNGFAVSGVTVSDAVSDQVADGASCAVTDLSSNAGPFTVPASGSLSLQYTCTYSSQPPYGTTLTNTATASWTAATYNTPDGSASSPAVPFTFDSGSTGNPTLVDQTITVIDCFANGTTTFSSGTCTGTQTTLGMLTAVDATPYTTHTYTVTDTVTIAGGACSTFTNTAEISTTSQLSQNVTVTICNEKSGALTMGFWQNKNGQGIITGGASTSGVCNVGSWLRQYNPFDDLSSTATCNQVATYVYNVIKAANASGASMNAMLKAQMLATALDVYFGGGPGGDPIKNYNGGITTNIGNIKINLTKVCMMIDSSSGTATCSGSTEDCSSAFGGQGCLTVSQILAYAASQAAVATGSNTLANPWYAQNKSTQGLAKDTFDAINNQAAYICP